MHLDVPRLLVTLAALACVAAPVHAGMQAILGIKLDVRDPRAANPASRSVYVLGQEKPESPNTVVGDPTLAGATLRLIARGGSTLYDETFELPAAGWKAFLTRHDWPVFKGFAYSNETTGGPVRSVIVQRGGFASPEGTPPPDEPRPGEFRIKVRLLGRKGAINVLPPDPGEEGGIVFTIGGGDSYCVGFGAAAGGRVIANTPRRFAVMRPTAEGCPLP